MATGAGYDPDNLLIELYRIETLYGGYGTGKTTLF